MPLLKKYDAVVIGSGASGAVMAYELATKGLKVLVLEKGKRYQPSVDFSHNELEMYAKLYKLSGLQTTKDNDTTIAQGLTVGGSTVINNAIWLRADLDSVLPKWKAAGADIPKAALEDNYTFIENKLKVKKILPTEVNSTASHFLDACQRLNIPAETLSHNREQCLGCGWCNYGCRYDRKTSMLVTFIPWAEAKGALVLDEVDPVVITYKNGVANGVSFMRHGVPNLIEAAKVVVCAGAIGSTEVLLKSGINPNGRVGKGLHLLGGIFVNALMPHPIHAYDKIGLNCIAHASKEYLIETFHSPPGIFSLTIGAWYREHFELMMKYTHMMQAGVMVGSAPSGSISLDKNKRVVINFKFSKRELQSLKRGIQTLTGIFLEAGAELVLPSSFKKISIANHGEMHKIDQLIQRNDDITLGSAHPQGGNIMNADPLKGVVNEQFEVHGMKNLYIADTSVWPTNLWANCQATTMAMSRYASSFI